MIGVARLESPAIMIRQVPLLFGHAMFHIRI